MISMELALLDYSIDNIGWGERSELTGSSLSLSAADLHTLLSDLSHGIQIDFQLVRPGESTRIIHVLDTVLPIAKRAGATAAFPGFDGPAQLVGSGESTRIKNLLVTVAGRFPDFAALTPIEKPREGILDLSGVGASYSYGSDRFHLVISLQPDLSVSNAAFDQVLRNIALRCAGFLARI
jgi:glycine reductase